MAAVCIAMASLACGGDGVETCTGTGDPDGLAGSFCEGAPIRFDAVELGWFEAARSLRIRYGIAEVDRVAPALELQLIEETGRPVLEAGVTIPVAQSGFVRRWPSGATEPQILTDQLESSSSAVFETLDLRVDGRAVGRFDLLFTNGRTLRGRFDGTLIDLTPPE
ncbi:MAG: hypothetical protein AAFZ18_01535 [Myxococcota bacterium]